MKVRNATMIVVATLVVIASVAIYWMMNDESPNDSSYAVSLSYDAETGNATGEGVYGAGEEVTVTAIPSKGYGFKGWFVGTEMVSDSSTYSFIAETDVILTPSFRALYTITIEWNRNCGTVTGSGQYMAGDVCTLTASPNDGCSLAAWFDESGYPHSFSSSWSFEVREDRYFHADMGKDGVNVTVLYDSSKGEVVPSSGSSVDYGTQILFSAYGDRSNGYYFDHWIINGTVSDEDFDFNKIITEDITVEAVFELMKIHPSVWFDDSMGRIYGVENTSYEYGTVLHLRAVPVDGYRFDHWVIDGKIYTNQDLSYALTSNVRIEAVFVLA
mgnify:CR=1 FL=1